MFTQHNGRGELIAFLVYRVGGILFTGAEEELLVNEQALRTFRAGDIEKLTPQPHIIFTGNLLGGPGASIWNILLYQMHDARELQKADATQFAQQGKSRTRNSCAWRNDRWSGH